MILGIVGIFTAWYLWERFRPRTHELISRIDRSVFLGTITTSLDLEIWFWKMILKFDAMQIFLILISIIFILCLWEWWWETRPLCLLLSPLFAYASPLADGLPGWWLQLLKNDLWQFRYIQKTNLNKIIIIVKFFFEFYFLYFNFVILYFFKAGTVCNGWTGHRPVCLVLAFCTNVKT